MYYLSRLMGLDSDVYIAECVCLGNGEFNEHGFYPSG